MTSLDVILNKIKESKDIVILTHENPDGDAVGTSLALYLGLKNLKKNVDLIIPKYSREFKCLPAIEEVKEEGKQDNYDLAIAVDCAEIKMLNGWSNYFENAKSRIVIDHHSSNSMFGDINFVDITSPACAQTVYVLFRSYNWEITQDIGTNLMAGIITDTGGFQYQGVSKETFEIASNLLSDGVNITKIYKNLLETRTKSGFELRRVALDRLEFLENGKVAFTYITKKDEKKLKCEEGDHAGIVNEGLHIEGVEVSIFLHESDEGYKISLRSNEYVNVSDVCLMFGGGGHIRAAGAKMTGTPKQIREKLLNEIRRQLKK